MTKPGFIQHPWSPLRGDFLRADCVIRDIEHEEVRGCGLYYEIYHYRVLCRLLGLYDTLNEDDKLTFTQEAARRGFNLDENSVKESRQHYQDTLAAIRYHEE
ncbi:hypothetical protein [Candidatus Symbiopectobacterium sp. NZEC151]|uniref:hypothetical protein n=1 Tax=Candidatus Symbiopectobacterium sp. NZEC151 TaxID=2820470 RepID=UPI002226B336|nr:hypothetical protein [Candidatus Symbiopectobacterium sp. NZEC151]MCW2474455.1 hypothetical protein [Candidatus Symbiopectobacterium sp. NZEC151]